MFFINHKEKVGVILLVLGVIIMAIAYNDIISILADIIGKMLRLNLPVVFFNSFTFRIILTILGGTIILIGGIILKKKL